MPTFQGIASAVPFCNTARNGGYVANRKFRDEERVIGRQDGPASYRRRVGTVNDFKGYGGYGVRFDDQPDVTEYVESNWLESLSVEALA
jgi:hypothetical protein